MGLRVPYCTAPCAASHASRAASATGLLSDERIADGATRDEDPWCVSIFSLLLILSCFSFSIRLFFGGSFSAVAMRLSAILRFFWSDRCGLQNNGENSVQYALDTGSNNHC